jgi:hypothetical protein
LMPISEHVRKCRTPAAGLESCQIDAHPEILNFRMDIRLGGHAYCTSHSPNGLTKV